MAQLCRIAKNARLGDGMLVGGKHGGSNAHIGFMSTDMELLEAKRKMCLYEGLYVTDYRTQPSGYGGKKTIYNFYTRVHPKITEIQRMEMVDLLQTLDEVDLYLWYMDDGSWHINRHTMHLYCNMLNDVEADILCGQIEKLYGVRPAIRKDRKRDGRSFNYLYFPRKLTQRFRPDFKWFITNLGITSMYYKFGGLDYFDPGEEGA